LKGGGISEAEARAILDLKPGASAAEIKAAYTRMHALNDPTKGGSPYLQAKIANAHAALAADEPAPPKAEQPSSSGQETK
jgi:hypothetical protein